MPRRDVRIVLGDLNAKVGTDNTGREETMGIHHGARAEINDNCDWADLCQVN